MKCFKVIKQVVLEEGKRAKPYWGLCSTLRILLWDIIHLFPISLGSSFAILLLLLKKTHPPVGYLLSRNPHFLPADSTQIETSITGLSSQCQTHLYSSYLLLDITKCVLAYMTRTVGTTYGQSLL